MSIFSIFKRNERLAQSIDQLNSVERLLDDRDNLFNQNLRLRAALIQIRNQGIDSKSGTAVAMARKAMAALN